MTTARQAIWDAIEARIDNAFPDGIAANGDFNERVYEQQRAYCNGLRAARLTAINAVEAITKGPGKAEPHKE